MQLPCYLLSPFSLPLRRASITRYALGCARPLATLVAHVLRALEIAGPDHVGLGSDFDGVPCVPNGIDDATFLPRLTYELLAAGQSEAVVKKVLGENLLRVFRAVEARALALRGTAPQQNDGSDGEPLPR